ncbi:uncharacterized protein LOC121997742 [Zingiber officinale]|uniref:Uncharacterized protein n=1 Tax=Zingiber officinale TaxID=94328 RepID=A0A8J5KVR6_ZINOF|nr:uncharacterized protein LOC121997742 [Zingiber officinale]KAG6501203.1 hypothetical protein ZIOFF_041078 [Zingiber officinale]
MASNPNMAANAAASSDGADASSNDDIDLLLAGLQLRPPYLGTNSLLPQNVVDFLLRNGGSGLDDEGDEEEEDDNEEEDMMEHRGEGWKNRRLLAKEESKLEREILRIIETGNGFEALKVNSGQSVAIGDHNICVGVHEEPDSEYRLWQWHGHIMLFDEDDGYSLEYIHGFHHELVPPQQRGRKQVVHEEEEKSKTKVDVVGNSGLKDLISGNVVESIGNAAGRVLHRNSLKGQSLHQGNEK